MNTPGVTWGHFLLPVKKTNQGGVREHTRGPAC